MPATAREQISLYRPFYPQRPGGARREHLMSALGLTWEDLLRTCERTQSDRQAACALFWTLGASQVGKAAISGWQEILSPALRSGARDLVLWPFDGPFHQLVGPGRIVIVETYPAEYYSHLELLPQELAPGQKWSKRRQSDRVRSGQLLLHKAREMEVALHPELSEAMSDGFGSPVLAMPHGPGDNHGEDRFDAVVGLFGMLSVVLGWRDPCDPTDKKIRTIEGWILGQAPLV